MPRQPPAGLTDDQQRFVNEYLIDRCALRAWRRAFGEGTSYAADCKAASVMLKKGKVREEIRAAQADERRRSNIKADKVLRGYARVAFADPLELTREDGSCRPLREIPAELRAAIAAVKVTRRNAPGGEVETVEYKLNDRLAALKALVERLGLTTAAPPAPAPTSVREVTVDSSSPAAGDGPAHPPPAPLPDQPG